MSVVNNSESIIVSSSSYNRSFSNRLDNAVAADKLNGYDPLWVQFLYDHFSYLRRSSTEITLTEEVLLRYRYRVRDYLRRVQNQPDVELAFRIMNRIPDDKDFDIGQLKKVYVPNINTIHKLYRAYATYKSIITKL